MTLPGWLRDALPADTAATWELLAPALPRELYLAGGTALAVHVRHRVSRDLDFFYHDNAVDLDGLRETLDRLGPFAVTDRSPGTLNGVFSQTRLQFLHADEVSPQTPLEPPEIIEGLRVAGIGDILAMKLKVVGERGELRDYFDIMTIEQQTGRTVEEGLSLFLARYRREPDPGLIGRVVRSLGYLDDVDEDTLLPVSKDVIASYWKRRQPEILRSVTRHLPEAAAPSPLSAQRAETEPPSGSGL